MYGLKDQPLWNDSLSNDEELLSQGHSRQATKSVAFTGNDLIDGTLSGVAWKGGTVTYAFPDSASDYSYSGEPDNNFQQVSSQIVAAARYTLDTAYGSKANDGFSIEGLTNLNIKKGADSTATIRFGTETDNVNNPTAYAYYPNSSDTGGDVWFGTNHDYQSPVMGNYDFMTVIHEIGHAFGLKHGHEGSPTLPADKNSHEYSIMTYASYVGSDNRFVYNEEFGFPQTYMMSDIAALQHMYGADYKTNSGSTVYSWKPDSSNTYVNDKVAIDPGGERIFATIWDGGGKHDVYDLHAYTNAVSIDLRPGEHSVFKDSQLADLGFYSADGAGAHMASGNIYNALLYKKNTASLIEDAVGGSGDDSIVGNQGKNILMGLGGADDLFGRQGNDTLIGNGGDDTFHFRRNWDFDVIAKFSDGDKIDLSSFNFSSFSQVQSRLHNSSNGLDSFISFGNGDTLWIDDTRKGEFGDGDFIL